MTTSTAPSGPPKASNRGFILVVVGVVILGLLGVAFVATQTSDEDSVALAEEQTAPVTIEGEPLTPLPDGVPIGLAENDPAVGTPAPSLTATDFAETEVTIEADGRPKVVYFLAHWCPHCQEEVGVVQGLIDDGRVPEGLDLYAVSTAVDAGRGNYPPQSWLAREGWEPVTVRDDEVSSALTAFGGSSFPYVAYLDGDNQVVARSAGGLEADTIVELWTATAAS